MERIKLLLTLDIDPETGETKCIDREIINDDIKKPSKKRTSSKKKEDNDPVPKITLEENKYILNNAAVEMMGVEPEDRLDIKIEKQGKKLIPVIGTNEAFGTKSGNRLTKTFTVSCRGKANQELSEYGTVFELELHPTKEGLFILKGDKEVEEAPTSDENIEIPEEDNEKLPMDSDLEGLTDDNDAKEISAFDFEL